MRFLIASDIHGSARWCGALVEAVRREGAEKLLLLGDILYHGPRNPLPEGYDPKAVAAQLGTLRGQVYGVRGNCDAEIDEVLLGFPLLGDYALLFAGKRTLVATHGHRYNRETPPPLQPGDLLLHGHTHVPCWDSFGDGNVCVNPGSVSLPKDGAPRGYILLTDEALVWKTLDGEAYHRLML